MGQSEKLMLHAVAGSGKTQKIIDALTREKEIALITYTLTNQNELRQRIIKKFDGEIPENIHIFGFWQFVYNFCLVPFLTWNPKGIIFDKKILQKYDRQGKIYCPNKYFLSNKISKCLLDNSNKVPYLSRIDEFFDELYIDEAQDFGGYDLNWLLTLSKLNAKVWCVGDFWQHTFETSHVGNLNSGVYKDFAKFKKKFENSDFHFDEITLRTSVRCTAETCEFIRSKLNIKIYEKDNKHSAKPILIQGKKISKILEDSSIKKLFYKEHSKYKCNNSGNWGDSKGSTFENVCVILNPNTYKLFQSDRLNELKEETKSKFYVACTRSKDNVYFVNQAEVPKK